ncbi:MAG: hypothetical protein H0U73_02515 [Tatlockia sp.]|nr:hypothetical protein [Tatlockia sp.]
MDYKVSISFKSFLKITHAVSTNKSLKNFTLISYENLYSWELLFLELVKQNRFLTKLVLNELTIEQFMFKREIISTEQLDNTLLILGETKNLTVLELVIRPTLSISLEQLNKFLEILNNNTKLNDLSLIGFSKESNLSFGKVIMHHPSIEKLILSVLGGIDWETGVMLSALIKSNKNLRALTVLPIKTAQDLKLIAVDLIALIFKSLENNQNLKYLCLAKNIMEDNERTGEIIATMIKKNKGIGTLNLAGCFLSSNNSVVPTILEALPDNQTLENVDLSINKAIISSKLLINFEKNTSLTWFKIISTPQAVADYTKHYRHSMLSDSLDNRINLKNYYLIQEVLTRNINLQFYKKYLLLKNIHAEKSTLPEDVVKFIYMLVIINTHKVQLESIKEDIIAGSYLKPRRALSENKSCQNLKIRYFKTIYQALYKGQSSLFLFKHWNHLIEKENLTESEIINYINLNPNSRTEKAWQLANTYMDEYDEKKLFKKVHQYSLSQSSIIFGLFKRSQNFANGYDDLENKIFTAEKGSRTETITSVLKSVF